MKDPRYQFVITISSHILLTNNKNQVLMSKRPETWEWGPGRWGVTGGKVYENENFFDSIRRKTTLELGFEVKPEGLYQVKQLLIKDKQAIMFFFVAKYKGEALRGKMDEYKWFGLKELSKTSKREFAEYFYKDMLKKFLSKKQSFFPVGMMESLDYVALGNSSDYKNWFDGMIKKDYDPNKLEDYNAWKSEKLTKTKNKRR